MSPRTSLCTAAMLALVAACGTPAPVPGPAQQPSSQRTAPAVPAAATRAQVLERELRERVEADAAGGRWADAVVRWEILVLLRPDSDEYRRELEGARRAAAAAAANHLRAAQTARARRNAEQANLAYLKALAAEPDNVIAIEGLRALETERVTRAWLNRPPRVPYPPPASQAPYDPTTDDGPAPQKR